jgi:uncharacterized protein (TIGR03790 family)
MAFMAFLALSAIGPVFAAPAPATNPASVPIEDRGHSVVVIYNTAFKGSKDVADHYAKRRKVPDSQVFGFQLPTSETIGRSQYESQLERPLVEALVQRQLLEIRDQIRPATETAPGRVLQLITQAKVRHIVVCYGVPIRTTNDIAVVEPEEKQIPEPLRRADASIDAELTALPLLLAGQPRTGPLGNPAYGTTNKAALQPTSGLFVVGRLDGPTPDLAKLLVDRAIEAEEFGLWGRGYFDIRSITVPAYKPGDQWISNAWVAASRYGYDTHLDTQPATLPEGFPLSHVAFYAGWYEANMNGPFTLPKVEFMPGAIAYHLHSYSAGALRSSDRTWVGPLIAKGVTATMGCVAEPYLDGTPDIGLCLARLMFSGFTWGEAALASQRMLSWQTTVHRRPALPPLPVERLGATQGPHWPRPGTGGLGPGGPLQPPTRTHAKPRRNAEIHRSRAAHPVLSHPPGKARGLPTHRRSSRGGRTLVPRGGGTPRQPPAAQTPCSGIAANRSRPPTVPATPTTRIWNTAGKHPTLRIFPCSSNAWRPSPPP